MSLLSRAAAVSTVLILLCGTVSAQTTGTLVGRVTDPSEAVVPGATVEVQNVGTGLQRVAVTDDVGAYVIPGLPTGAYKITVSLQGFTPFVQEGINVRLNENARVDARLQLTGASETITVQADAVQVDTQSSTLGAAISTRQIETLPLNGRNALALAQMLPGVGEVRIETAPVRGGARLSVGGSRPSANSFMLDGTVLAQGMNNAGLNLPNPDALEEFRILTHNYSAEYGRAEGAILTALTKSGTNQLRGTAWEFLRNDALNGRNFFASSKPYLRQNQFGASVSGPVVRNRTFFFGSYEGLRIKQQQLIQGFPATEAERRGDFSAFPGPIIDPTTGQPFPGNIIPAARFDPLARNMLSEYTPLPNQPDGSLQQLRSVPRNGNQLVVKIDQQLTSSDRVSYRLFRNKYEERSRQGGISERLAGSGDELTTSHSGQHNLVFNPSLLNELRVSYTRWDANIRTASGLKNPEDLGALFTGNPDATPRPPNVNVVGRMTLTPPLEFITPDSNLQVDNKVFWSRGRHDLTTGFRFMRNRHADTAYQWSSGNFSFNGSATGNAMADFLIGRPSSYGQFSTIIDDAVGYEYHAFVSDDFRVARNLTLNLGVRYSLDQPWVQIGDRNSTFRQGQQSQRFPNAPPGLVMAGDPGVPRGLYPTDKNNFSPRLGLAWDPTGNGRTSVRAGYGVFYAYDAEGMSAYATNNAPFILPIFFRPPSFSDPYRGRQNPFPYDFAKNPQFIAPFETISAAADYETGYSHHYNLNVQQQIGQDLVATVAYVGSLGRNEMQAHDINTAVFRPGATAANIQDRRPILPEYYAGIGVFTSDAKSQYDSLQVEVQKRFSQNYAFQLAYTLSKATTDASIPGLFNGGIFLQDPINRFEANEGPTPSDQRHVFALNGTWDIPAPRDRGVLSRLVEGWGLAGTLRLASGLPINVTSGCDCALIGEGQMVGPQRPNRVGDPELSSDRPRNEVVAKYFDPAAYALPQAGQFGNEPRHSLVGPGFAQTDLVLWRRFPVRVGSVQFRAEVFNLFNQVNFLNPTAPLTSPGFGRLVAARDPRIVQFGLKYEF